MRRFLLLSVLFCSLSAATAPAAPGVSADSTRLRFGLGAGMGVEYLAPREIVDMINGAFHPATRLPEFHAGVNFFVVGFVPLSADWMLKVEYAYLLNTYNIVGVFGPGEFTMEVQMPSLVLHYMLVNERFYNLSAGLGAGYHVGAFEVHYGTLVDTYKANGIGGILELQGNTAISEDLFVHLGAQARWEGIGVLRNEGGKSPGINAQGEAASMAWFAVGARIGMSYYF